MKDAAPGLSEFLKDYSGMSLAPSASTETVLQGDFEFSAQRPNGPQVTASFNIKISVPVTFPRSAPKVWETGRKIPLDGRHHTNPDRSLCLGSPLQVQRAIHRSPTLVGFAETCLVPFLYAVIRKIDFDEPFYMGELSHGLPGIIDDYKSMFGLSNETQVLEALKLLGLRRRVANKEPCPCSCGRRLGACRFRFDLNALRPVAPRSWFRRHAKNPGTGI